MTRGTVVLLGNLAARAVAFDLLAQEFGWSAEPAAGLDQLRDLSAARNLVAVLFDASGLCDGNGRNLAPQDALRSVREVAPQALLIPCHRFSDVVNWPDLAQAGAFHALALPFDPGEVRQSLGFVWSAGLSRAAKVLSIRPAERREGLPRRATQLRDAS